MILLDTNALVFDALVPARLTMAAKQAIQEDEASKSLACCDISLWEIAVLVGKDRIRVETDVASFLRYTLTARGDSSSSNHARDRCCFPVGFVERCARRTGSSLRQPRTTGPVW